MLLQAAIGDAYGAGFEFCEMDYIHQHNQLEEYLPHIHFTEIHKNYTDDTQMAIAIAELMLENEDWSPELVADKFVEVFHRDKRRGYSGRVYNALGTSKNGKEFIANINNQSGGNGSAMRAYSIGLFPDLAQVLHFAEVQAKTSHDTVEGISCAKRIALASHYFYYDYVEKYPLSTFLNEILNENEVYETLSPVDMHGYPTTKTVINLVPNYQSLAVCLKESIDLGGDTDTVASLSMALLSLKKDTIFDLPDFLFEQLENGAFGSDYLMDLDTKLKEKYPIPVLS